MELQEAILKRRSIRRFTDYFVTDDEIREVIEAARWAPSWANTQVWEFIVARDRKIIEDVVSTYSEKNPARKCSNSASVLIVACAKKGVSGHKKGSGPTKFSEWFMFDIGMAVQNLILKAHEIGIGSVVVGLIDHNACARVLDVPDTHEVVVVIPLGKSGVEEKEGPPRKEIESFVYKDRFGEAWASSPK
ncbi:MAG: nitroreductase family protein [Halobacteriota archaeon]|nr:nitroreductase family protein [Halobacteriota archaeon]